MDRKRRSTEPETPGSTPGGRTKKHCTDCGLDLLLKYFTQSPTSVDGYFHQCKSCSSIRAKTSRFRNLRYEKGIRDHYCEECGEGPFSGLPSHVSLCHNYKDYVSKYGKPSNSSSLSKVKSTQFWDNYKDGKVSIPLRTRRGYCQKGHRLSGKNVIRIPSSKTRRCRICENEYQREKHVGKTYPKRRCLYCRQWFQPKKINHTFCSQLCGQRYRT
jgi:hypothetical protein